MSAAPAPVPFDKYGSMGAYHWRESDPGSPHYNPPVQARYQIVVERVGQLRPPPRRLLDLGCGDGYLLSRLSPLAAEAWGIEPESAGARLARRQLDAYPNCVVLEGSGYQLPFPDRLFDLVTCTDVIEHLSHPEAALREIRRVLRPQGRLVLTTPRRLPGRVWDRRHVQEFRPSELAALLRPHFAGVELEFFWPLRWSKIHSTRIGWRLLPPFSRIFFNPFLARGGDARRFGQILAVCGPGREEPA